jgi:O-antigen/teichoic acid export membrane protein
MAVSKSDIEQKSRHQIRAGAIISYFVIAVQIVITLVFTPWLARYLGTSNYGLYTLGSSLAGIFMLDLGLSAATSKFLSEYRAAGDKQKEADFLGLQSKLYLIIDAVVFTVAAVVFFFLKNVYQGLDDQELSTFKIIYLIVCGYSLISLPLLSLNGIFTANEAFVFLKTSTLVQRLLSVGMMAASILLNLDVEVIMLCYVGSSLVVSAGKVLYLKFKCGTRINFHYHDGKMLHSLFAFSIWIAVITIAQRLNSTFVPQILGMVHDTKAVAVYGFASQLEGYTYQMTTVVAGMFMPKIARLMKEDPHNPKLYDLFLKIGKLQLVLIGLILIGFLAVGRQFVVLLMGPDYEDSYICAILLIAPSLLSIPKTPMESHCYLTNNVKYSAIIIIVDSIIAFLFYFLFGHFFGAVGVSAVYCVSLIVARVLVDFLVYGKKQGIPIMQFWFDCYMSYFIAIFIPLCVSIRLPDVWKISGWKVLICQSLIIIAIYGVTVWLFYLNKKEREWIKESIFKRQKHEPQPKTSKD